MSLRVKSPMEILKSWHVCIFIIHNEQKLCSVVCWLYTVHWSDPSPSGKVQHFTTTTIWFRIRRKENCNFHWIWFLLSCYDPYNKTVKVLWLQSQAMLTGTMQNTGYKQISYRLFSSTIKINYLHSFCSSRKCLQFRFSWLFPKF
jgi:hypothetical protein